MNLRKTNEELFTSLMNQIGEVTLNILELYQSGSDNENLLSMVTQNHKLLANLGVSCPRIEEVITILQGQYNAKLTGAGLGGFVIGLKKAENVTNEKVYEELENHNFTVYSKVQMS